MEKKEPTPAEVLAKLRMLSNEILDAKAAVLIMKDHTSALALQQFQRERKAWRNKLPALCVVA